MGSNTSTPAGVDTLRSSHQSSASSVRRSTATAPADRSLDDEFSDSILHKVHRDQPPVAPVAPTPLHPKTSSRPRSSTLASTVSKRSRSSSTATTKINLFGSEPYDPMEDQYNEVDEEMLNPDLDDDVVRHMLSPSEDVDMLSEDDEWRRGQHIDEMDFSQVAPAPMETDTGDISHPHTADAFVDGDSESHPVEVKWANSTKEHIRNIAVIGSFTNWHGMIPLHPRGSEYVTTLDLPLGVHKMLYVVNNEYRVSELLPTATDSEGVFFNWFEVVAGQADAGKNEVDQIHKKSTSLLTKVSKETDQFEHIEYADQNADERSGITPSPQPFVQQPPQYSSDIPEMFVNYDYFKVKAPGYELPEPPQLPAHLNNVLINKLSGSNPPKPVTEGSRPPLRRADSSYYASNHQSYHLSIPNHVILNHLMTTSIRNEVLTVACITRYSGKFITQIMHSPSSLPEK